MKIVNRAFKFALSLFLVVVFFIACKKSKTDPPVIPTKNKLAYIYKTDNTDATNYKTLMEANNCEVTLVDLTAVATTNFSSYQLIVVGTNTATPSISWTSPDSAAISSSGKPLLLIGVGGFRLGDKLNLKLNWGNSGQANEMTFKIVTSTTTLFTKPKNITIPANQQLDIYTGNSTFVGRIVSAPPLAGVELIGQSTAFPNYHPIAFESGKYGAFGYYSSINNMTQAGKDLMVNLSYYVGNLTQ